MGPGCARPIRASIGPTQDPLEWKFQGSGRAKRPSFWFDRQQGFRRPFDPPTGVSGPITRHSKTNPQNGPADRPPVGLGCPRIPVGGPGSTRKLIPFEAACFGSFSVGGKRGNREPPSVRWLVKWPFGHNRLRRVPPTQAWGAEPPANPGTTSCIRLRAPNPRMGLSKKFHIGN